MSSWLDSNMSVIRKLILFWASEMIDDNSGLWDVTLCWGGEWFECLAVCDGVSLCEWFLTFERNIMPSSSKVR